MNTIYKSPQRTTVPVKEGIKTGTKQIKLWQNILMWVVGSVLVNLALEILQRRSLAGALVHTFSRGHIFLINTALILLSTVFMLIVKRKLFAFALPASLWMLIGITNTILLSFRPLPISFSDFRLVGEATQIFDLYLKTWQIILIAVGVTALISGLVLLFIKGKKFECTGKATLCVFLASLILLGAYAVTVSIFDFFPRTSETPNEFYERNGFAYNFFKSAGRSGVYVPEGYSEDTVEALISEIESTESEPDVPVNVTEEKTNIIVIQLESFMDMSWMHGINMTEDPTPNFRRIKENGPSGYLFVPSYGGGTSNVEFEVLSGMNLDHFAIGESPYYTLLKKNVLNDAAPFNMRELGYSAHAIHNHNALFYERNNAYNNLGFDTFTPIEYMNGLSFNSLTWAKDDIITSEVMSALDSTEGRDFVFAVSVQGHGPNPTWVSPSEFENYIEVTAENLTDEASRALSYYASTIHEMDKMIGELVNELEGYGEDCVLVLYGDHLPAVDFSVNYLSSPNAYTSEYAIWSNFGLEAEDKDLETYQLLAHTQSLLGYSQGVLTKLHQSYALTEDYQEKLKLLEFSMTNGESVERTDTIKYSTHPVKISEISVDSGDIVVHGENFTPYSKITVGGNILETVFESPCLILADADAINDYSDIAVSQLARDNITVLETIVME